jgi:hypothetical protein
LMIRESVSRIAPAGMPTGQLVLREIQAQIEAVALYCAQTDYLCKWFANNRGK